MSDVILSCGHARTPKDRGYLIYHKGMERDGSKSVNYSLVCSACKKSYRDIGELFTSDDEAFMWLESEEW